MLRHVTDYLRFLGVGEVFIVSNVTVLPPGEDGQGSFEFKYKVREG